MKTICEIEFEKWWKDNKFEDPSDGPASKIMNNNMKSIAAFAWNSSWVICSKSITDILTR